jgi:hypothetical protein
MGPYSTKYTFRGKERYLMVNITLLEGGLTKLVFPSLSQFKGVQEVEKNETKKVTSQL